MTHSAKLHDLAPALVTIKAKIGLIKRTATTDEGWKYAPLEEVLSARNTRLLSRHGVVLTQACETYHGHVVVTTMVLHKSGQYLKTTLELPVADCDDPRAVCSVLTLARRYGALAALGLATEDDDGYRGQPAKGRASMKDRAMRERADSTAAQRLVEARQKAHREGDTNGTETTQ